jgi:hypothetical protein
MKKFCTLCAIVALAGFVSCQKQQTDEERKAEIDQQVEQRLAAERQAQEKDQLAQRAADLDAREKAVADQQGAGATATPDTDTQTSRARSTSTARTAREGSDEGGDYNIFYTKLDRYGEWRETSDYGYVWQPREAERSRNWHPYTEGRWVYTDAGWTWVSEEPFGWATYHYGRWTRLRGVGWVWVPGNEWAPAWVSWRKSNDYVGWAPLPPEARFDRRHGIHNWADNYYDIGPDQYRFVATQEFGNHEMQRTVVPRERNVTIINQTTNVTNITYSNTTVINQGPSYDEIRTRSQQPIERLRLERDVNINLNVEVGRPVVRGEVIAIPAPVIAIGRPATERPRTVKAAIAQTVVEHGWEDIGDKQAAEQARTKMKSESTPPPDAPSKTFVKPEVAAAQPAAATSAAPAESAAPTATATGTATPAPSSTPSATPVRARPPQKPLASATPSASEAPSTTPSVTPAQSAPAKLTETPSPSASPTATPKVRFLGTPATINRTPPRQPSSLPTSTASPKTSASESATTSPAASATAAASSTPRSTYQKPEPAVALTPRPRSTSPTPTVSPSVSPNESAENSGEPKTFGVKKSLAHEPRQMQPMSPSAAPSATTPASAKSAAAVTPTPASTAGSTTAPSPTGIPEEKGKQKHGPPKPGESVSPTPTPE